MPWALQPSWFFGCGPQFAVSLCHSCNLLKLEMGKVTKTYMGSHYFIKIVHHNFFKRKQSNCDTSQLPDLLLLSLQKLPTTPFTGEV